MTACHCSNRIILTSGPHGGEYANDYLLEYCAPSSFLDICRRFKGTYCSVIAHMMESVSSSETSVNFCDTTLRNFPEDSQCRPEDFLFETLSCTRGSF
jgi:hypothetical protein